MLRAHHLYLPVFLLLAVPLTVRADNGSGGFSDWLPDSQAPARAEANGSDETDKPASLSEVEEHQLRQQVADWDAQLTAWSEVRIASIAPFESFQEAEHWIGRYRTNVERLRHRIRNSPLILDAQFKSETDNLAGKLAESWLEDPFDPAVLPEEGREERAKALATKVDSLVALEREVNGITQVADNRAASLFAPLNDAMMQAEALLVEAEILGDELSEAQRTFWLRALAWRAHQVRVLAVSLLKADAESQLAAAGEAERAARLEGILEFDDQLAAVRERASGHQACPESGGFERACFERLYALSSRLAKLPAIVLRQDRQRLAELKEALEAEAFAESGEGSPEEALLQEKRAEWEAEAARLEETRESRIAETRAELEAEINSLTARAAEEPSRE